MAFWHNFMLYVWDILAQLFKEQHLGPGTIWTSADAQTRQSRQFLMLFSYFLLFSSIFDNNDFLSSPYHFFIVKRWSPSLWRLGYLPTIRKFSRIGHCHLTLLNQPPTRLFPSPPPPPYPALPFPPPHFPYHFINSLGPSTKIIPFSSKTLGWVVADEVMNGYYGCCKNHNKITK